MPFEMYQRELGTVLSNPVMFTSQVRCSANVRRSCIGTVRDTSRGPKTRAPACARVAKRCHVFDAAKQSIMQKPSETLGNVLRLFCWPNQSTWSLVPWRTYREGSVFSFSVTSDFKFFLQKWKV